MTDEIKQPYALVKVPREELREQAFNLLFTAINLPEPARTVLVNQALALRDMIVKASVEWVDPTQT